MMLKYEILVRWKGVARWIICFVLFWFLTIISEYLFDDLVLANDNPPPNSYRDSISYIACRNTLSDAAMINEAITNSHLGSEIVFSGQCLINQSIKLIGHRTYRGVNRTRTVLKQADGANLFALIVSDTFVENKTYTGSPVSVSNFTLDGNRVKNTESQTTGLVLRSWLTIVENMVIRQMGGDGLQITSIGANGSLPVTSQVNGRISGNFIEHSGRYGVYVEDPKNTVTDWYLTDNWIAHSENDGIHLDNAAGWMITGNHLYGMNKNAIYANRLFGTTISNNYIEGFGRTGQAGIWHGIYATIQGGSASSTISNNRIFNYKLRNTIQTTPTSKYRYIALKAIFKTGAVNVTGNAIRGARKPFEVPLHFSSQKKSDLIVTSSGNGILDFITPSFSGGNVSLSAGE